MKKTIYRYIGSPDNCEVRPFEVNKIYKSVNGLLQIRLNEGGWYLYEDSKDTFTSRQGHWFTVIETINGLPSKVAFKENVSDPRFYVRVD